MAKFPPTDTPLVQRVEAVVRAAWDTGNPVAGHRPEGWIEIAVRAVRRWRSSARRGISLDDRKARVRDLAKGLAEALTGQRKQAEGLALDWDFLAEQIASAFQEYESTA
jgi:hypothetical protein